MSQESLLEFPCQIPIKVLGRNDDRFRSTVLRLVHKHFAHLAGGDVSERLSKADKYVSLTVTVHAETREQIDAAYRDLSADEYVMMVL
jgi:putative lipoic acid-binding regulatory protein